MKKQTAVEWLAKKIGKLVIPTGSELAIEKLVQQAKEIEKQQIIDLYSEVEMLDFAWFLVKNIGQYSSDETAHFEGKYLEQFKNK
jgi:hypothetical protein